MRVYRLQNHTFDATCCRMTGLDNVQTDHIGKSIKKVQHERPTLSDARCYLHAQGPISQYPYIYGPFVMASPPFSSIDVVYPLCCIGIVCEYAFAIEKFARGMACLIFNTISLRRQQLSEGLGVATPF